MLQASEIEAARNRASLMVGAPRGRHARAVDAPGGSGADRSTPRAARVGEQPTAGLYTTAVTQAEILHGLMLLPTGRRRRELEAAVTSMFAEDFEGRILGFGSDAAPPCAKIATSERVWLSTRMPVNPEFPRMTWRRIAPPTSPSWLSEEFSSPSRRTERAEYGTKSPTLRVGVTAGRRCHGRSSVPVKPPRTEVLGCAAPS